MVDFAKAEGLVPVVIQDDDNGDVLMLGYMNEESLHLTVETGQVWFWRRSRRALWHKGPPPATTSTSAASSSIATTTRCSSASGPSAPVCHTGERTCFYRELDASSSASSS